MSGKTFCRICLNELSLTSRMNTSLTTSLRLCEECFNNVTFANQVKQTFMQKEKDFIISEYGIFSLRSCCKLCFRFETPDMIILHKDNLLSDMLRGVIEIALSELTNTNSETIICGMCWSRIKNIYSFKKKCFKIEESLKWYCFRNNLPTLTDEHLEAFIYEEYHIKTGNIFDVRDKDNTLNTSETEEVCVNTSERELDWEKDDNCKGNGINFMNIEIKDNILTLQEGNDTKKFEVAENDNNHIEISDDETEADADDIFDENVERRVENNDNMVIISDDDDDNESNISADKSTELVYISDDNENENILNKSDKTEPILVDNTEINKNNDLISSNVMSSKIDNNNNVKLTDEIDIFPEPLNPHDSDEIVEINPSSTELHECPATIEINHSPAKDDDEYFMVDDNEKEIGLSDDLLLLDEDCFEIVKERNNIIDISNVDSYILEKTSLNQRTKSAILEQQNLWGCYMCIAKFNIKCRARRHMLLHQDPWNTNGRFRCRKCPFKSNWKGSVTRHEKFHTKASFIKYFGKTIMYFCPYCSNIYTFKGDMQSHINEHVISWKNFQCCVCAFTTKKSLSLRHHYMKSHCHARDPNFSVSVNWGKSNDY